MIINLYKPIIMTNVTFTKAYLITIAMFVFALRAGAQTLTAGQNSSILKAQQGAVLELPGYLTGQKPIAALEYLKVVLPGPQFIISDDPEYIRVPEAIALQENVNPGTIRLYLYNVNGIKGPEKMDRKITVLIKNVGKQPLHIRMLKHAAQKPSTSYFKVGKETMADFYASEPENNIRSIQPGQAIPLDEQLETNIVKYDELVHGIYEFVVDQPAEISVLQTDPHTPGVKALNSIKTVLAPKSHSGAGRGLYGVANYKIKVQEVYNTQNGPGQVLVADGVVDPWIMGTENTTGQDVKDVGNYGVIYHVNMKWKSGDGRGLALVTWNPRCGAMSGAMVTSGGKFNGGIISLPSDRVITKGAPEVIFVQLFVPEKGVEEQTIELTYSPPAAGCLPTPLVFIPVDLK
jgi:hypothetical protein